MATCVFAYLYIQVVRASKKSQKNYRRHHLKKMFLRVLLHICIFVFKSKKSQHMPNFNNVFLHYYKVLDMV
jgi:hypothetical protein